MAQVCTICGRGSRNVNSRSHSNIATARRVRLNLQTLFINGRRVVACTSCIRRETKRLNQLTAVPKKQPAPAAT